MLKSVLAISIGASLGALLRWALANRLNGLFPFLPPGTLLANLVGGYVIGIAMAYFATRHVLPLEWRLFVVTGFCGGLTTFSTFSAEVVGLLQQGRVGWAAASAGAHLAGSVLMTVAGIATVGWMRS